MVKRLLLLVLTFALAAPLASAAPGVVVFGGAPQWLALNADDPLPELSIDDATLAEGDSGTVTATFTVTLSAPSDQIVAVAFATADDTASAPRRLPAGCWPARFRSGRDDAAAERDRQRRHAVEANETFLVNLSAPPNATIADGRAWARSPTTNPTISIDDVTVTEGNTGTVNAVFTVTLSPPARRPSPSTTPRPTAPPRRRSDYATASGTLTFAPGQTSRPSRDRQRRHARRAERDVPRQPDRRANATIADGQASARSPTTTRRRRLDQRRDVTEGTAGTTDATFTVTLSAPPAARPSRSTTRPPTAPPRAGRLRGGQRHADLRPGRDDARPSPCTVNGDPLDETERDVHRQPLGAGNATIADGQGLGTITDDDAHAGALDQRRDRDRRQQRHDQRHLHRHPVSAASGQTVTVNFATADGTAHAPGDYTAPRGTLTLRARADQQDHHRAGQRRHARRGRTRRSPSTSPAPRTPRSPTARASARSPTTTTSRRSRSTTSTVTEGNSGTTAAAFTVTPVGGQRRRR